MIITHDYGWPRKISSRGTSPNRRRRFVSPCEGARPTGQPSAAVANSGRPTFVFDDGTALSPTEVATLRAFAAAGIRPLCVVDGSDRAPDAGLFRVWLSIDD